MMSAEASDTEHGNESARLPGRALFLSWLTVLYNLVEGVVSLFAAYLSGSPALLGFGLDSFVESLSGSIMIWRFRCVGCDEDELEHREARALRLVGIVFLVFAAYVLYESGEKLLRHEAPGPSIFGIFIAVVSLIIMPILARAKHHLGTEIGSRSLVADSQCTMACAWLSAALLLGLCANWLLGWWWADPVAGLVVVWFLAKEGLEAARGEECACGDGDGEDEVGEEVEPEPLPGSDQP